MRNENKVRNVILIGAIACKVALFASVAFPTAHAQTTITPAEARAIDKEAYIRGYPMASRR
jgi:hypothetical protein